jgi:hypothetical protein
MEQTFSHLIKAVTLSVYFSVIINPIFLSGQNHKNDLQVILSLKNGKKIGPCKGTFISHDTRAHSENYIYYYHLSEPEDKDTNTSIYKVQLSTVKEISNVMQSKLRGGPISPFYECTILLNDNTSISPAYLWYLDGFKVDNKKTKHQQLIYITNIFSATFINN